MINAGWGKDRLNSRRILVVGWVKRTKAKPVECAASCQGLMHLHGALGGQELFFPNDRQVLVWSFRSRILELIQIITKVCRAVITQYTIN